MADLGSVGAVLGMVAIAIVASILTRLVMLRFVPDEWGYRWDRRGRRALCSIGTTDCKNIAEAPDQTELPFNGMEEAGKHAAPDGKYVKVASSTRACPGLSRSR